MSFPIARCVALLLAALATAWPALTLAKGGGGGGHSGGGGHAGGGGHSCGQSGHSGSGWHSGGHSGALGGSAGHWSGWTGRDGRVHHVGGYGFGNPAQGYTGYIAFDATWNNPLFLTSDSGGYSIDPQGMPLIPPQPATSSAIGTPPGIGTKASAAEFIEQGETAFKRRDYAGAVQAWRHAALDDPQNGVLMMKFGQALFATGQYREAAFAIQVGMDQLPMADWGDVVGHYSRLYGEPQDYTDQLRALEAAIRIHKEDPALRFVAGFEYGYLGFLEQSLAQLDEADFFSAHDEMTGLLRNEMRVRLRKSSAR